MRDRIQQKKEMKNHINSASNGGTRTGYGPLRWTKRCRGDGETGNKQFNRRRL